MSKSDENRKEEDPLSQMIAGKMKTQMLAVAARLKIAELLVNGPRSVTELAELTSSHSRTLYRLLRALASLDIFAEKEEQIFEMTPLSERLLWTHPQSVAATAAFFGSDWHNRAWSNLLHNVQTGECAFEKVYQTNVFDYLEEHRAEGEIFDQSMSSFSRRKGLQVAQAYDFSKLKTVVDIGGGQGLFIKAILEAHPSLQGVLYDRPSVVEGAILQSHESNLNGRLRIEGGDFFKSVPHGADGYILKSIIHDWDDERAEKILRNCREAMSPDGKILLVESIVPEGNEPSSAKLFDIEMLLIPGGAERTKKEFQTLLSGAGLKLNRIISDQGATIIEVVLG